MRQRTGGLKVLPEPRTSELLSRPEVAEHRFRGWTIVYSDLGHGAAKGPEGRARFGRRVPFTTFTHYGNGVFASARPEVLPRSVALVIDRDLRKLLEMGVVE